MADRSDRLGVEVLLVEDDEEDARYVERLLTTTGAVPDVERIIDVQRFEHVSRIEDAITALDRDDPDVLLLDLNLPDSEGLATLESVAQHAPHLPIVVVTGRTDSGLGPRAIREGAQDYLAKGRITDEVLRRTLRYAIDRHEKQREIIHANYRLSLLNRILRQDVRNDVSTVVGWGEELLGRVDGQDEAIVESLLESAEHAADLTETASELLALLSTDTELELEPTSLDDVLEQEVGRLRARSDVDVVFDRTDVEANGLHVRGTPMLSSVFEQLLSNAVQHNDHERPSVRIGIESGTESVSVTIADDGIGIADPQRELLNDPDARYRERSGIGTGLYLVTNVLDQIGGEVRFEKNRPRGTAVSISLPRADPV